MANENRFKLKLSRIFRSSLGSCRSKHLSDTIQKSVLSPETLESFRTITNDDEAEPLKSRSFSSLIICGPKDTATTTITEQIDINNCIRSTMNVMLPTPRPRLSHRFSNFSKSDYDFLPQTKPIRTGFPRPSSSVFPLNPFYEQRKKKATKKKNGKSKAKSSHVYKKSSKKPSTKKRDLFPFSSSSLDSSLGGWWFSSSDDDDDFGEKRQEESERRKRQLNDDETDTLFSYQTPSSDSSEHRRSQRNLKRGKEVSDSGVVVVPVEERVKQSFAVVKKSSDPHNDFRTSMVEMIVEKQIFSANDLESLLQCFLSLNSEHHHCVIVEVFTEILEALFSNCGS